MNTNELYNLIGQVDDRYLDLADAPAKENVNMNKTHITARKALTYFLAAAIAVSLLMVTAAAAGWIPNIFAAVKPSFPEDAAVLEAALQVTQTQEPEIVTVPEVDFTQFTLFERYYDGESILLGYDLTKVIPETVVGYQPDAELLAKIQELPRWRQAMHPDLKNDDLETMYADGFLTEEAYRETLEMRTEKAIQYNLSKYWQIHTDCELKQKLSAEDYEKFWDILLENGSCCVAFPGEPYVSDHIFVNGADCGEVLGPDCGNFRSDYETEAGSCILLKPLPEAGQDQDSATVELRLRSGWYYWYMELDGDVYERYEPNPDYTAVFTLENVNN